MLELRWPWPRCSCPSALMQGAYAALARWGRRPLVGRAVAAFRPVTIGLIFGECRRHGAVHARRSIHPRCRGACRGGLPPSPVRPSPCCSRRQPPPAGSPRECRAPSRRSPRGTGCRRRSADLQSLAKPELPARGGEAVVDRFLPHGALEASRAKGGVRALGERRAHESQRLPRILHSRALRLRRAPPAR